MPHFQKLNLNFRLKFACYYNKFLTICHPNIFYLVTFGNNNNLTKMLKYGAKPMLKSNLNFLKFDIFCGNIDVTFFLPSTIFYISRSVVQLIETCLSSVIDYSVISQP